jgi:TRAP-type C4-dicarboxylate transport system permease small subunit
MKVVKWLDEHFEEALLIFLLAMISIVELMQVVCRNIPVIPSLTWAEELCRFLWIATVFLSLPFTIRTATTLRVTALVDVMPWKVHNVMNILIDVFNCVVLAILGYYSITAFQGVLNTGELSPAMQLPMWIMYTIVVFGFILGAIRAAQMAVIDAKNINVKPMSTVEEQAAFELEAEKKNVEGAAIESAFAKEGGEA